MDKNEKQAITNVLEYAARQQAGFSRAIENMNGYKTITTFGPISR